MEVFKIEIRAKDKRAKDKRAKDKERGRLRERANDPFEKGGTNAKGLVDRIFWDGKSAKLKNVGKNVEKRILKQN